jgi:hypothetical protein
MWGCGRGRLGRDSQHVFSTAILCSHHWITDPNSRVSDASSSPISFGWQKTHSMLSDSEDDDDLHQITVNEHYAKAFQYRKEREELDKRTSFKTLNIVSTFLTIFSLVKAELGSDISESDLENEETDSESDESEDEDGEELTMAVDAAILRTLARIKRKDPSIYESDKNIFGGVFTSILSSHIRISLINFRGRGKARCKDNVYSPEQK